MAIMSSFVHSLHQRLLGNVEPTVATKAKWYSYAQQLKLPKKLADASKDDSNILDMTILPEFDTSSQGDWIYNLVVSFLRQTIHHSD